MAVLQETCKAVMLRSEKCVNHFLDSAVFPDSRFGMVHGIAQFAFQAVRQSQLERKIFIPIQRKGLAQYGATENGMAILPRLSSMESLTHLCFRKHSRIAFACSGPRA
jgi:hypothetical protein